MSQGGSKNVIVNRPATDYIRPVNRLTKHEQWVLCVVLGLLLVGWAVKAWRTAHPSKTTSAQME